MPDNTHDVDMTRLPLNAMSVIPEPRPDAKEIVALVKENGRIWGYQLSDGQVLSREEGVEVCKNGGIRGVGVATKNGTEYLKSLPDGTEENNLSSLRTVDKGSLQ